MRYQILLGRCVESLATLEDFSYRFIGAWHGQNPLSFGLGKRSGLSESVDPGTGMLRLVHCEVKKSLVQADLGDFFKDSTRIPTDFRVSARLQDARGPCSGLIHVNVRIESEARLWQKRKILLTAASWLLIVAGLRNDSVVSKSHQVTDRDTEPASPWELLCVFVSSSTLELLLVSLAFNDNGL